MGEKKMLRHIKGEMYKSFHRKYLYVATLVMAMCIIGASFVVRRLSLGSSGKINREWILSYDGFFVPAVMVILLVFLPVFSDDYKNHTHKNLYMSLLSVKQIFICKYIAQVITAIIMAVILYTLLILCILSVPCTEAYTSLMLMRFFLKMVLAIPLFAVSILVIDVIFSYTGNELFTFLIYYYGYMQVVGLMVLSGGSVDNPALAVLILPVAVSNLSNMPLTVLSGLEVVSCGIVYTLLLVKIGAKRYEKLNLV